MSTVISASSYSDQYVSTYIRDDPLLIINKVEEVCQKKGYHPDSMLAFDFVQGDGTRAFHQHSSHSTFMPPEF